MTRLPGRVMRWLDEREPPTSLALVRIFVGVVLLADLLIIGRLHLVEPLFAPGRWGGIGAEVDPPIFGTFGTWLVASIAAGALALGALSRVSALVLLVCSASLARALPDADRGIDMLLRWVLLFLAFSGAGATFSLDALVVRGHWAPRDVRIPAWPRRLLVWQLCVVYFFAGIQKQDLAWTWEGSYSALWFILHDPHYASRDLHRWLVPLYPVTQLATIATIVFERSALLVPFVLAASGTPHRGPLLWRLFARAMPWWLLVGVGLHVGIAITMNLGIFPWAMLALYPAFLRPAQLARLSPSDWRR